ncbi:uncharacterized protein LOC114387016 [Glycine soja]|uniref:uncharacterized protein LOC114387016 n=1 Tax=Glycine soja TaxID=3848 RepID=UPI00103BE3F1|nr:uncharacterized protein LOC114387016 [Glycine soja]
MAPADSKDIVADIPADTGAEAAEAEHEGFPGGPSDPSVLTQYADHVACSVWTREECPELKLSSHGRKVHSLGRSVLAIEGLVVGTELSPLIMCSVDTGDRGLLSSFVERWHRETSSFHLPVGELTITLDDVSSLLHLPVVGDLHAFQPLHVDDTLNDASISHNRQLGGYITLLQCWIYEHFSLVANSTIDQEYDEDSPRACSLLRWGPVAIYYRPERVVRQFGYTQTIPAPPVDSWVSYDDIHDRWMHYSDHIVPAGEVCAVPGQCASDYMDWFFRILHPFMTPGHASDPLPDGHAPQPRVVPQAPQTDIPHVPEPGASSTSVEEPRHAVEVYDEIAERLERHLSLGVVTPGSSTHEVIEECLRMARSVKQDHLVYVRSRRRRRTDQA